jgi:diguanylate cyclase (GGDEF)-like protein
VIEAANGQLALDVCSKVRPDIAVLNVEMPIMGGWELLRRLKGDPKFADMPVIFLTGRTSTSEIVEGLKMGAHDYLRKPFEPPELIARVSAAIRVARLQQELNKQNIELDLLSRTDQLTGLPNRRSGEESLEAAFENSQRYGWPITILMIDVDHFKLVNDHHGHAGGDAVLKEVARRMSSVLRTGDVAARWGGEEFLIVLPNTDLQGGALLAERLLDVMREKTIDVGVERCTVTVSVGVASDSNMSVDKLVQAADGALYLAKQSGRDRLEVAS